MRLLKVIVAFLIACAGISFGQVSHVNVQVYNIPHSISFNISDQLAAGVAPTIPKNTFTTKKIVAETKIPQDPNPIQAGKFLVKQGVTCCQPLEHAHDNWYWCCDKQKLIQIAATSQSAKLAFEKVLSKAAKLDDQGWAHVRAQIDGAAKK